MFQINDIVLDISPEQIHISRKSFNHQWQTLRTSSSTKVKSGFSTIDIVCNVKFTDTIGNDATNGYEKLQALVAQFRVTPFCYVANDFLRDTLVAGDPSRAMALAVRGIEIRKQNDDTNVIEASFNFAWFNYFPYIHDFAYKQDIFMPTKTYDPRYSKAWKRLYFAEMNRHGYYPVRGSNLGNGFGQMVRFVTTQYATVKKSKWTELAEVERGIEELRSQARMKSGPHVGLSQEVKNLEQAVGISANTTEKILQVIQSAGSSMFPSGKVQNYEELRELLRRSNITATVAQEYNMQFYDNEGTWSPVVTNKGDFVKLKSEPSSMEDINKTDSNNDPEQMLLSRYISLDFEDLNLIPTGISISFGNILATMPLAGHPYPTYQHIGSTDIAVTISFTTTNRDGLRNLSKFYSISEDQSRKFRNIPQGQRNIELSNELIQFFGLKEFIIEDLVTDTTPGQPGTYHGYITLIENPVTAETREQIYPGASFTTRFDIRNIISETLLENLTLDKNFAKRMGINWGNVAKKLLAGVTLGASATSLTLGNLSALTGMGIAVKELLREGDITNLYLYTPKSGIATDSDRDSEFKALCIAYALGLSKTFAELITVVQRGYKSMDSGPVRELFSLRNNDVVGIEKLQADLFPIFQAELRSTSLGRTGLKTLGRSLDFARRDSAIAMKNQYNTALKALQRLEYEEEDKSEVYQHITGTLKDEKREMINAVAHFIDNYLDDWIMFSTRFLDHIMVNGIIELPQFKKARDAIAANQCTSPGGSAYPDFPLAEVIQDLQIEDPQLYEQFRKYSNALELNIKNIRDEALLNPDFYFFDEVEANTDRLIGTELINQAIESVRVAQTEQRLNAEKSFIEEEYTQMLGYEKLDKINKQIIRKEDRDPEFYSKDRADIISDLENKLNESSRDFVFYPDDLFSGSPLLCTLGEAANNGEAIDVDMIDDVESNIVSNIRPGVTLQYPSNAGEVQHTFGWEAVDFLSNYPQQQLPMLSPNKTPQFSWPTAENVRKITQYGKFTKERPHPSLVYKKGQKTKSIETKAEHDKYLKEGWKVVVRPHDGIDLNQSLGLKNDKGQPVYAAADGYVKAIRCQPPTVDMGGYGNFIYLAHTDGWETRYAHLQYGPETQALLDNYKTGNRVEVRKGQQIGRIGNTGDSVGPHLHFETRKNGVALNPEEVLAGRYNRIQGPPATIDPNNESLLTRAIDQFEKDLHNGQGYSMARAYPAFKLYFIESDLGERKRFGFDDFFGYSAVKDIALIRSRKIAADLCIIQLTNISGVLSNRRFQNDKESDQHKGPDGQTAIESTWRHGAANTARENPIVSIMLQPGIQVQLRLGYNNNPEELEKVFNGVITDVAFSENDDLVEITCQSFAIELVQTKHGHSKTYGGFLSRSGRTGEILEDVISYPEVVHFGRWEGGDATNTAYGVLRDRWRFTPQPEEDNIFAPTGRGWKGLLDSTVKYSVNETTVWDVFQEMTLRHPGYIASAVPYDGKWGPRMTMFFGCPEQMYFARDPTFKEDNLVKRLEKLVDEAIEKTRNSRTTPDQIRDPNVNLESNTVASEMKSSDQQGIIDARDFWLKKVTKDFLMDRGVTKSFRNYHVLTSTLHILHNDIISSAHNTFNTVTVQYKPTIPELALTDLTEILSGEWNTFTLRCDAALPDEEVRETFISYENCRGFEQAKRYALATLTSSLKEGYKGSIIILGNPRIKPYDICYIFDEYSDMFGPIEVEQVIHRFSQETGFITEITPDMVVNTNRLSGLSTADAMGLVAEAAIRKIGLESVPGLIKTPAKIANVVTEYAFAPIANMFFNAQEHTVSGGHSTNPAALMGAFIFKKLLTRSQLAHPIRYSPLVKHGKPMLGGLPSNKVHGSFSQGLKKWAKDSDRGLRLLLEDTYDKFVLSNWCGHWQGSASSILRGELRSR